MFRGQKISRNSSFKKIREIKATPIRLLVSPFKGGTDAGGRLYEYALKFLIIAI